MYKIPLVPDMPLIVMEQSEYSKNKCIINNKEVGLYLYQANCLEFMDKVIEKYPDGKFDMIFAEEVLVAMLAKW